MPLSLSPVRSFLLGGAVSALGALVLLVCARSFAAGATWSPVHQTGGPGFVFVIGPAVAGWFWVGSWVKRDGLGAVAEATFLGSVAALAAGLVGLVLARAWPAHPAVLESLFSTIGVALVVSAIASVSVRLASEPNPE